MASRSRAYRKGYLRLSLVSIGVELYAAAASAETARRERSASAIAPYSLRARESASVATPVGWSELSRIEQPDVYTIANLPRRMAFGGRRAPPDRLLSSGRNGASPNHWSDLSHSFTSLRTMSLVMP